MSQTAEIKVTTVGMLFFKYIWKYMAISHFEELFKLPVKTVDENNEWNEGVESDFCLSASSQSVTACLHGTLEKFDLKAFFQRGFCNTCFTLWKSIFNLFPKT